MSAYKRLKSFARWVKLEQNPSEDREMHAEDIEKVLAVFDAARELEEFLPFGAWRSYSPHNLAVAKLKLALKELGEK